MTATSVLSSPAPRRPSRDIRLPHGFTAREYQLGAMRFFDNGGLRYSGVWHRRAGKDRVMLAQTSKMAHRKIGLYWHCLPTLKQARKACWDNLTMDGRRLIDTTFPAPLVKRRHEDEMKIELHCGSIVQFVGSDNHDSLLGANPVHVTFSEWATTDPQAWQFIRPILLANGGTAAFISTPRGYNHCFDTHEIAKKGEGWLAETFSIDDTSIITRGQYETEIAEGMPEELARQEYLCDFSAANVGSVLGRWLEAAEADKRIGDELAYDPDGLPVVIASDIGYRDASAWWIVQPVLGGFNVLAYDEARGLDAADWIARLQDTITNAGWSLGKIYLPHDARVKTFQSKRSSVEQFIEAFGADMIRITPRSSVADRISAARKILKHCAFNRSACKRGLQMLRDWHFAWDEETKVFSTEPEHDYASHGGDAFSYLAQVVSEDVPKDKPVLKLVYARPLTHTFTLEDLHKMRGEAHGKRHF